LSLLLCPSRWVEPPEGCRRMRLLLAGPVVFVAAGVNDAVADV
jgi:hypothetical protein